MMIKKITLKPGDRVAIIEHGEIKEGILRDVHALDQPVAIVDFDGDIKKVPIEDLAKVEETKDQDKKVQEARVSEGARRITKDEMIEALHDVTSPEGMLGDHVNDEDAPITGGMFGGLVAFINGMKIVDHLYQDEDVITITEDQLRDAVIEGCNPMNLKDDVGGQMELRQLLPISILSTIILKKMIKKFFPVEADND